MEQAFTLTLELDQSGPIGGNGAMQITRATDYATRVMIYLATLPPGVKAQRVAMAKAADVPESFLSKLLQRLVSAGLVASSRGSGGGYELAGSRRGISLLDILEAMEGETRLNACLADGPSCDRKSWCPAHPVWQQAQKALTDVLRGTSLAKLAKEAIAGVTPRRGLPGHGKPSLRESKA
jgi:Rrf2 family protein